MKIGILPCQDSCNVGMMTNKVALRFWVKALARQVAKGENFEYAEAFHRVQ